jgi:TnpA family transposase
METNDQQIVRTTLLRMIRTALLLWNTTLIEMFVEIGIVIKEIVQKCMM